MQKPFPKVIVQQVGNEIAPPRLDPSPAPLLTLKSFFVPELLELLLSSSDGDGGNEPEGSRLGGCRDRQVLSPGARAEGCRWEHVAARRKMLVPKLPEKLRGVATGGLGT